MHINSFILLNLYNIKEKVTKMTAIDKKTKVEVMICDLEKQISI